MEPPDGEDGGTLTGACEVGLRRILSTAQNNDGDARENLDKVSVLLNAPYERRLAIGVCGATSHQNNPADDAMDVEWEQLAVRQNPDSAKKNTKEKVRNRKLTKEEIAAEKQLAQISLLTGLAEGLCLEHVTNSAFLQAMMLSLLPDEFMHGAEGEEREELEWVASLYDWFHCCFTRYAVDLSDPYTVPMARTMHNALRAAIKTRKGTAKHLVLLFVTLLKALGKQTRLVGAIEVPKRKLMLFRKPENIPDLRTVFWCEMWPEEMAQQRWHSFDPLRGTVDSPEDMETLLNKHVNAFVVAFYGGGFKDISPRYISNVGRCAQIRKFEWWHETVRPYANLSREVLALHATAWGDEQRGKDQTEGENDELKELDAARRRRPPQTLDDFKHSLNFVLERFIKRYEGLKPGTEPVDEYRDEPYYSRSNLVDLHSKSRWLRHGRIVKQSELQKPHKQVKKYFGMGKRQRGLMSDVSDAEDAEEEEEEELLGLYGEWQTKKWKPPVAKNGVVPKNEYGKVDVPPLLPALPKNTTHVRLPRIVGVCLELGIDFAEATVGFDNVCGGRSVPRTDGVVVCSEHAELLVNAFVEREEAAAKVEYEKRMDRAKEGWRQLLTAVDAHLKLQERYAEDRN